MSAPTSTDLAFATLLICVLLIGILATTAIVASELEKIREHLEGRAEIKEGKHDTE